MKLINNFLSLGYGALYSEALAVARKSGLSVQQFDSVIRGGRMDCGFYGTFMGYALEGKRDAHKFTLSNAYKDMRYVEAMANAGGCVSALSSAIKNSYAMAVAAGGNGPEDYVPHLADFVARENGTRGPFVQAGFEEPPRPGRLGRHSRSAAVSGRTCRSRLPWRGCGSAG